MKEIKIKLEDEEYKLFQEVGKICRTSAEWVIYWILKLYSEMNANTVITDICNEIQENDC